MISNTVFKKWPSVTKTLLDLIKNSKGYYYTFVDVTAKIINQ